MQLARAKYGCLSFSVFQTKIQNQTTSNFKPYEKIMLVQNLNGIPHRWADMYPNPNLKFKPCNQQYMSATNMGGIELLSLHIIYFPQ